MNRLALCSVVNERCATSLMFLSASILLLVLSTRPSDHHHYDEAAAAVARIFRQQTRRSVEAFNATTRTRTTRTTTSDVDVDRRHPICHATRGISDLVSPGEVHTYVTTHCARRVLPAFPSNRGATVVRLPAVSLHQRFPCLRPSRGNSAQAFQAFDEVLLRLPETRSLEVGRRVCRDGRCDGVGCGLTVVDAFATAEEAIQLIQVYDETTAALRQRKRPPRAASMHAVHATRVDEDEVGDAKKVIVDLPTSAAVLGKSSTAHAMFQRVVERLRHGTARSMGIPLERLKLASGFLSRMDEFKRGDEYTLHCDESSFSHFHYSAVLWLNTYRKDDSSMDCESANDNDNDNDTCATRTRTLSSKEKGFNGGRLRFFRGQIDEEGMGEVTRLLPEITIEPRTGRAAFFSSGWESMHQVERVKRGTRYALPVFWTTTRSEGKVRAGGEE